jgi:hypothetical protein
MPALEAPLGFLDTPPFHPRPKLKPLPAHIIPAQPPATLSPQRVQELISLIRRHHLPKPTAILRQPDDEDGDGDFSLKIGHFDYGGTRELDGDGRPIIQAISMNEDVQGMREIEGSGLFVLLLVLVVAVLVKKRVRRGRG